MSDGEKGLSQTIDDFFDVRTISAVLIGFTLTKWVEVIVEQLVADTSMLNEAAAWPIVLIFFVVIMANAGKETNHQLKRHEFEAKIEELVEQLETKEDTIDDREDKIDELEDDEE